MTNINPTIIFYATLSLWTQCGNLTIFLTIRIYVNNSGREMPKFPHCAAIFTNMHQYNVNGVFSCISNCFSIFQCCKNWNTYSVLPISRKKELKILRHHGGSLDLDLSWPLCFPSSGFSCSDAWLDWLFGQLSVLC